MEKEIRQLLDFLDRSHSVYHAQAGICQVLRDAGYTCLRESQKWELVPGGKYFVPRGGSAVMAFRVPETLEGGFMMSAAHCDRPTFKMKENGELVGTYTRLTTEKYGGMLTGVPIPGNLAGLRGKKELHNTVIPKDNMLSYVLSL